MSPAIISFSQLVAAPSIILASLGLTISIATAQKTNGDALSPYVTTTIWAPEDYDGPEDNTYASVIAADATATTYRLNCVPSGLDKDGMPKVPIDFFTGCSAWPSVTLTAGSSTAEIVASNGGEYHMTRGMACKVDAPAAHAQCDFFLDGRGAEAMAKTGRWPMDPITASEFAFYSQAVTITAGVEKIRAVGGDQSASPAPTTTTARDGGVGDDQTATITSPAQGEATVTGTVAAGGNNASTSGVARSRGNVVMGAVVVLFGVCLL